MSPPLDTTARLLAGAVRILLASVVVLAIAALAMPILETALFVARLAREPAPAALPVPVAHLDARSVRDSWGAPRPGGRRHEGIDLMARRGTPVLSATHGVVVRVGSDRLGGNVVWVLGPAGQRHYYAHLDRFAPIARGERITRGTVLGYVGDTGNARGGPPHLHYGIYAPGRGAINPYPLLAASRGVAPSQLRGGGAHAPPARVRTSKSAASASRTTCCTS